MTKQITILFILILGLLLPGFTGTTPLPQNKQTTLGLYVTAKEAYEKWQTDPVNVKILDVRTPEEYAWIGHPAMAHNVPFMLFKEKWYTQAEGTSMMKNADFVSQVKKKFKATDTLFLICRSGGRSAMAVNALAQEGFKNAYSITDGFEGEEVKDENSYFNGKRMMNGWKNSGAPWTYELNPELVFRSVLQ
ncbi:MAG: rhodanese-like domain-containing protein [Candidatus Aminicenantes bacterium]|nr:rhodanese-like domain-containing protein [Candidatus Aminicenantes bacterium]